MKQNNHSDIENPKIRALVATQPSPILLAIIVTSIILLTLETVVRFSVCPHKRRWFSDPLNVLDSLCLIPILIFLSLMAAWNHLTNIYIFACTRAFSILICLRLLRHLRKVQLFRVLVLTLKYSLSLQMFICLILVCLVMVFGAVIFIAEINNSEHFWSIPEGYWWAIVTITTVGYGDVYPVTLTGYFVGALCAVTGVLVLAMPIPILSSVFNNYYNAYQKAKRVCIERDKRCKQGIYTAAGTEGFI